MAQSRRLILASGSPRRRELLTRAGIRFDSVESGVAEAIRHDESAAAYATRTAREKARTVSERMAGCPVLGADTVVECDGRILEKPRGPGEAHRMLQSLSGRTHHVITAFALAEAGAIIDGGSVLTRVTFRPLSDQEINSYIESGDPFDKAGGYGIQGEARSFISHVDGSWSNVMGLPVDRVVKMLKKHGIPAQRGSSQLNG